MYSINNSEPNDKYYEFINYYNTNDKDFIYDLLILLYNKTEKHYMQFVVYIDSSQ